ncbi:hypothetical protein PII47_17710 [Pseudomonas sp. 21TX0197]|uniref:hypothetical protein n=1 Tax=Pseudomonas TaxID=286 RepID=UPI0011B247EB|nr:MULTISPECIES: hypothetical protein [Pseudomonas]MCR8662917.1 hypothetical protein [Pseudomonas carnis]MDB6445233.1 hypothetical protein [Pseudomonas sp. 21TX0197]
MTAPVPLGVRYLVPVIAAFRGRHPRLGFDLQLSGRVVDLYGGDIVLAVRVGFWWWHRAICENRVRPHIPAS